MPPAELRNYCVDARSAFGEMAMPGTVAGDANRKPDLRRRRSRDFKVAHSLRLVQQARLGGKLRLHRSALCQPRFAQPVRRGVVSGQRPGDRSKPDNHRCQH